MCKGYAEVSKTTKRILLINTIAAAYWFGKTWVDDFDASERGFYCRFYGRLTDTPLLKIEIVGSLYHGQKNEEIEIFPFVNGKRVAPCFTEQYIWKSVNGIRWDTVDPGFEGRDTMESLLYPGGHHIES